MHVAKKQPATAEKMHIIDAIDHLSNMAELDARLDKEELFLGGLKTQLRTLKELTPSGRERVLNTIKSAFHTVHRYLKHIYHKEDEELKDLELQQGIQAMMKLAIEAGEKLSAFTGFFQFTYKEGKLTEIRECEELKKFYFDYVLERFQEVVATEELWESQWEGEDLYLNIEKIGLKDLETVKRDQQYELFSIKQEDGSSFFNRNLLRHIKLITDFDQLVHDLEGEDPLLMVHLLSSKLSYQIAKEIKDDVKDALATFSNESKKHRKDRMTLEIKRLMLPLALAASEKNILTEAAGKTCTLYLDDWHRFLRALLVSEEYEKLSAHKLAEMDAFGRAVSKLVHRFCFALCTPRVDPSEWIKYVCYLAGENLTAKKVSTASPKQVVRQLLSAYQAMETLLRKYPNGPLFKAMDLFRERAEITGFDPLLQGNFPLQLYDLETKSFSITCLRLPCPTQHQKIHDAVLVREFTGYLRTLAEQKKPGVHLLLNLQDFTSWQEHSRCEALHEFAEKEGKKGGLVVLTLPKKGDFYYQAEDYAHIDETAAFLTAIEEQIGGGKSSGFLYSLPSLRKEIAAFSKKALPLVCALFFRRKKTLTRKERLDFIEIFYVLLALKGIDVIRPQYVSFTCKDSVDIGAVFSGLFFTFVQWLSGLQKWEQKEQQMLLYLLFSPALMVRERLLDHRRFQRGLSALEVLAQGFEKDQAKIKSALSPLYKASLFQALSITTASGSAL